MFLSTDLAFRCRVAAPDLKKRDGGWHRRHWVVATPVAELLLLGVDKGALA
jgi:hypothetical protein